MLKQLEEYLVWLILKLQFHAVLAQLSGSQIELEYAEAVQGSALGMHNNLERSQTRASVALFRRDPSRHIRLEPTATSPLIKPPTFQTAFRLRLWSCPFP
jgi:hypothetical protein